MVERSSQLDLVFGSLADATRRDILRQVAAREMTVGEVAAHYQLTFAAVSKHLQVLERARLVSKKRKGRTRIIRASPEALRAADKLLEQYRHLWEKRLDRLEAFLTKKK